MRWLGVLPVLLLLFGTAGFAAGPEQFGFSSDAREARYQELINELRCLVCQNQSLADSNAELARDLRREVYRLMQAGRSDAEIAQFMVDRYGDFVLYRPPVKPSTYGLWYGPFVLLAVGLGFLVRTVRRRNTQDAPRFSAADQARLNAILGEDSDGDLRR
ncbi:MAG TPA: cytochrome c-type biogenesis protein [Thiohalobacter sp.]|nr:cytochrome c-type biogenesis protein [Thiohalobacter sp.]